MRGPLLYSCVRERGGLISFWIWQRMRHITMLLLYLCVWPVVLIGIFPPDVTEPLTECEAFAYRQMPVGNLWLQHKQTGVAGINSIQTHKSDFLHLHINEKKTWSVFGRWQNRKWLKLKNLDIFPLLCLASWGQCLVLHVFAYIYIEMISYDCRYSSDFVPFPPPRHCVLSNYYR